MTASDSFTPTKGMVAEAKRALEWRKEFKRGGTAVGIARARDIANGKNLPYKTVKRMKAFLIDTSLTLKLTGLGQEKRAFLLTVELLTLCGVAMRDIHGRRILWLV